jgi:zinc finger protein
MGETPEGNIEIMEGETCPFCNKNTLTLREAAREIPYFGLVHIFSMDCSSCNYHKADLELEKGSGKPVKYTLEVENEDDLRTRIVKSATATVKVPFVGAIEPGEAANGYVTNVEGVLNRLKHQLESFRDNSDDANERKKAKNILKKLQKVLWGQEKIKIIVDDPQGNSAIISEKAVKK